MIGKKYRNKKSEGGNLHFSYFKNYKNYIDLIVYSKFKKIVKTGGTKTCVLKQIKRYL